jgi:hypothetical protein
MLARAAGLGIHLLLVIRGILFCGDDRCAALRRRFASDREGAPAPPTEDAIAPVDAPE